MSIAGQATYPESALCRFLDAKLPRRGLIVEEWTRQADKAPWSAIAVEADRRSLGLAAEYRIGLDLAPAPGYWDLLSFLSPMECNILLRGAGFHPADRGFGIADLVVGRCLVEIKTVLESAKGLEQWLNQLLGYALLDWFDALYID
jgi:hypothetical protein